MSIAATADTSPAVGTNGLHIARIELVGTPVSATLQFEVSMDGSVFRPTKTTTGSAYTLALSANASIPIPPEITKGGLQVRIKTASIETSGLQIKAAIERD